MNTAAFMHNRGSEPPIAFYKTLTPDKDNFRWDVCGDVAEEAGDFFCNKTNSVTCKEALGTIGYVLNEILENAIKFNCGGEVNISCILSGAALTITVSNNLTEPSAESFRKTIEWLKSNDPFDLLMEKIEANALDPEASGSGIGLLTLMSDYEADLNWSFSTDLPINVTTIAKITMRGQ